MPQADPIPQSGTRLARALNRAFHPFILVFPALAVALQGEGLWRGAAWLLLVTGIILPPTVWAVRRREGAGQMMYQRESRHGVYLTFGLAISLCTALLWGLGAPRPLLAGVLTMALWTPAQFTVNYFWTKISAHTGVLSAVITMIVLWGRPPWPLILALGGVLWGVGWARRVTHHHSWAQVALGYALGAAAAALAFSLSA